MRLDDLIAPKLLWCMLALCVVRARCQGQDRCRSCEDGAALQGARAGREADRIPPFVLQKGSEHLNFFTEASLKALLDRHFPEPCDADTRNGGRDFYQ